jgi:hypothetical protein
MDDDVTAIFHFQANVVTVESPRNCRHRQSKQRMSASDLSLKLAFQGRTLHRVYVTR